MKLLETETTVLEGQVVGSHTHRNESPGLSSLLAGHYVPDVETNITIRVKDGEIFSVTEGSNSFSVTSPNSIASQERLSIERRTHRLFGRFPVRTTYRVLEPQAR